MSYSHATQMKSSQDHVASTSNLQILIALKACFAGGASQNRVKICTLILNVVLVPNIGRLIEYKETEHIWYT